MARIGVIGGTGLYSLLDNGNAVDIDTKYGRPSGPIMVGSVGGEEIAFLPRHGEGHSIPPHKVLYKANIEALAKLGVERIIATNAVGSLNPDYKPGDFVIFDQFINHTHGREDTFFDGPEVIHVSLADPYCPEMRKIAAGIAKRNSIAVHPKGTIAVINGPRFSSRAESKFFAAHADVIGMTQYPEAALARERQLCYLGIGVVTDYDAGLGGREDITAVNADDVVKVFSSSMVKLKALVLDIIKMLPIERDACTCKNALANASMK